MKLISLVVLAVIASGCGNADKQAEPPPPPPPDPVEVSVVSDTPFAVRMEKLVFPDNLGKTWLQHDIVVENTSDRAILFSHVKISKYLDGNSLIASAGGCGAGTPGDDGLPSLVCTLVGHGVSTLASGATMTLTTVSISKGYSGMPSAKAGAYVLHQPITWAHEDELQQPPTPGWSFQLESSAKARTSQVTARYKVLNDVVEPADSRPKTVAVSVVSDPAVPVHVEAPIYQEDFGYWFRHSISIENVTNDEMYIERYPVGGFLGDYDLFVASECEAVPPQPGQSRPSAKCDTPRGYVPSIRPKTALQLSASAQRNLPGMTELKPGTYVWNFDIRYRDGYAEDQKTAKVMVTYKVS